MPAAAAATLYSNRAAAHLALSDWDAAAADAQAAVTLQPAHVKALRRLATARNALGHFRQAVAACRAGEAALAATGDRSRAFQPLLEQVRLAVRALQCMRSVLRADTHDTNTPPPALGQISTAAALSGSVAAFDGRVLHVRSAGEDAWLCKAAPASVEHDVEPPAALLAWGEEEAWGGGGGGGAVADGALQVRHCTAAHLPRCVSTEH
jgi:hypothetical protein